MILTSREKTCRLCSKKNKSDEGRQITRSRWRTRATMRETIKKDLEILWSHLIQVADLTYWDKAWLLLLSKEWLQDQTQMPVWWLCFGSQKEAKAENTIPLCIMLGKLRQREQIASRNGWWRSTHSSIDVLNHNAHTGTVRFLQMAVVDIEFKQVQPFPSHHWSCQTLTSSGSQAGHCQKSHFGLEETIYITHL